MRVMDRVAKETGGQHIDAATTDPTTYFHQIAEELRSQYIITYKPANQNYDGRERKIEVRFLDKDKADKYRIRTKKSYRQVRDTLK